MSVGFELKKGLIFDSELNNRLNKFFFDPNQSPRKSRISRTSSSDSEKSELDCEKPAGVDDWQPLVDKESEQCDGGNPSWFTACLLETYNNLEYVLAIDGLKWALLSRCPADEKRFLITQLRELTKEMPIMEESYITTGCIFGLGSTRQSELRDCIIIAVGTSCGLVAFYTEKGVLLFYEKFAVDSSIHSLMFDVAEDGQLLTVVTDSDIFATNAFSLHSVLLQCKSMIAKEERTAAELSESLELECDRIELEGRCTIRKAIFTGITQPSNFELYVNASLDDFTRTVDRNTLPSYTTFFVHSDKMFGTFAWYPEGDGGNIWSEAVSKIASNLVPHFGIRKFFGFNSQPVRKSALSRSKRSALARSVLNDNRDVATLSRSPRPRSLLALVDCSARVLLIDLKQRQIVRMWKGYRDAQVAWITSSHEEKSACFLVVYAPRRALIEIWSVQNGSRVAAQHVDGRGILLEGGETAALCGRREGQSLSQAYFVDSEGEIFEISVPFHLALVRETTHEQHDQLILAKVPSLLQDFNLEAFIPHFRSLRTSKVRRHVLLLCLNSHSNPKELSGLLNAFKEFDPGEAEIIERATKIVEAYDRLCQSSNNDVEMEDISPPNLPFNDEVKALILRHLEHGEPSESTHPCLKHLTAVIDWQSPRTDIMKRNIPDLDLLALGALLFEPMLSKKLDPEFFVDQIMPRLPFSEADIVHLLSMYFLNTKSRPGCAFFALPSLFMALYAGKDPIEAISTLEKFAVESRNGSRALLWFAAVCITRQILFKDDSKSAEDSLDWEAVDPVAEHADCTLIAMHYNYIASSLHTPAPYSKFLQGGGGHFREQIAAWIAEHDVSISDLEAEKNELLVEMRARLPHCLAKDLIYADAGWEIASGFFRSMLGRVAALERSIEYVSAISDARLQHGVARLIWDKFIAATFQQICGVIEKTGRAPKDREARKVTNLTDRDVPQFLCCVDDLLSILMDSVRDVPTPSVIKVDHELEVALEHPPTCVTSRSNSRDSLVHIASRQSLVNYHLVLHHKHLTQAAILIVQSGIRQHLMTSLFCSAGRRAFFLDLDSHPLIPLENVDDNIVENRDKFVAKVTEEGSEEDRQLARKMAHQWGLTIESIAVVHVIALLRVGDDEEASRELVSVPVSRQLSQKLTRILASRVLRLASENSTALTSSHQRYLHELAAEEFSKVTWPDDNWRDAIISLGKLICGLSIAPDDIPPFVRIEELCKLYWALQWTL